MSTPNGTENGEPGQEQSFLSHLIELRQRLVRSAIAVVVVFLALSPFMKEIFDVLSEPMMAALPAITRSVYRPARVRTSTIAICLSMNEYHSVPNVYIPNTATKRTSTVSAAPMNAALSTA